MAQIQPFQVWKDGQQQQAENITVVSVFDDLDKRCRFHYSLSTLDGAFLLDANLEMTGQDYIDWDNSNTAAVSWVCSQLNITLV